MRKINISARIDAPPVSVRLDFYPPKESVYDFVRLASVLLEQIVNSRRRGAMLHGYVAIPRNRCTPIEKVRLVCKVENLSDVILCYAGLKVRNMMYALDATVQVYSEPQHLWFGLEQEIYHCPSSPGPPRLRKRRHP